MKLDLVKKSITRQLQTAWDSAEALKDDIEAKLYDIRLSIVEYDVNEVLKLHAERRRANEVQEDVEFEYQFLFDAVLPKNS